MRRRGFTLIELMVVVTVIVILMSIAFKLAGMGDDQTAYATTVHRIQCMKNALSGYNAAFGSYPPVKLHASREINLKVEHGMQDENGATVSGLNWNSVNAACRAQPVGVSFPFADDSRTKDMIASVSKQLQDKANSSAKEYAKFAKVEALKYGFAPLSRKGAQLKYPDDVNFNRNPVFRFGVMSFLLPRYLFMTKADNELYRLPQWTFNNEMQKRAYSDGRTEYTWEQIKNHAKNDTKNSRKFIEMLPSQAACARWMPNLEHIVVGGDTFFGVNTCTQLNGVNATTFHANNPYITIYCPTGNRSQQYVLDFMTVEDGWGRELYYYSEQPYQDCDLWSAGKNGRTFPPWEETSALSTKDRETAEKWMSDDVR